MRPLPRSQARAVLQPFNVMVQLIAALILAYRGAYTAETLLYLGICLPVKLLAAQLGTLIFARLSDDQFRRLLIGLTLALGSLLMIRELF